MQELREKARAGELPWGSSLLRPSDELWLPLREVMRRSGGQGRRGEEMHTHTERERERERERGFIQILFQIQRFVLGD